MTVATTVNSDIPDSEQNMTNIHITYEALAYTPPGCTVVPLSTLPVRYMYSCPERDSLKRPQRMAEVIGHMYYATRHSRFSEKTRTQRGLNGFKHQCGGWRELGTAHVSQLEYKIQLQHYGGEYYKANEQHELHTLKRT